MNIIYNLCKDCGNIESFRTINAVMICCKCNSTNVEHNVSYESKKEQKNEV